MVTILLILLSICSIGLLIFLIGLIYYIFAKAIQVRIDNARSIITATMLANDIATESRTQALTEEKEEQVADFLSALAENVYGREFRNRTLIIRVRQLLKK